MTPENNGSINKFADVPIRVKTWVYIIIVFGISLAHPVAMKIFVSWISFQVLFELLRMFQIKKFSILIPFSVAIFQLLYLLIFPIDNYFLAGSILLLLIVFFFITQSITKKQMAGIAFGLTLSLFIFPVLFFIREWNFGVKAVVFLVLITEVNDVFQYLMGKFFGKHKITPNVSPNKTWEGFIGGVFLTMCLSMILGYFLLPFSVVICALTGLVLGIFGFFGDVLMSFIKRKTKVKDTGTLLPGHGGLLDRMDSLIFNAPLFWLLLPMLT